MDYFIYRAIRVHFSLPDRVTINIVQIGQNIAVSTPEDQRQRGLHGYMGGFLRCVIDLPNAARISNLIPQTSFNNQDRF